MLRVFKIALLSTVAFAESTWGPVDSVHALDGVVEAVGKIVKLPHLSPAQLDQAKKIATDVKNDVEAVESGKLSKAQAHEKVGASLKELAEFETELTKPSATDEMLATLKKHLAEKQASLAKAQKMMHLLNLQKELMEKKLLLQKLLAAKANTATKQKTDEQEAALMSELVKKVQGVEAHWNNTTVHSALGAVRAREEAVSKRLSVMDATEKRSEEMMESALKNQIVGTKGDALVKGQAMLKQLKKREQRKFAKARAQEQLTLDELKDVESKLEKHDVTGLPKSLLKIEQASKSEQAKSGKFLY